MEEHIYIIFVLYEQQTHGIYSELVNTCKKSQLLETLNEMIDVYFKQLCSYIDITKVIEILDDDMSKIDGFNILNLKIDNKKLLKEIITKLYFINEHLDLMNRFKKKTDRYSRFWIDIK